MNGTQLAPLVLALVLGLSACGGSALSPSGESGDGSESQGSDQETARTVEIYSAVVRQLLTEDHTFGGAEPPFERVFILEGVVEGAGDPMNNGAEVTSPFSSEVRAGMTDALTDLPPVEFVSERDAVLVDENECPQVRDDGVLISLGPIEGDAAKVSVANSFFFSCRGGQWLTYVVERSADEWTVTGTTGPVAIS